MGVPTYNLDGIVKNAPAKDKLKSHQGAFSITALTFTFSTSYANPGGEAFDLVGDHPFQFRSILAVVILPKNGWTFHWDASTKKIVAFTTANTEVANAANLSVTPGALTVLVIHR